jgi:hypothetical protein
MEEKPWSQGPKELLNHAVDHLKKEGGFDVRIAMVSVDNAVELMIKTYLELPKRITGLDLSRKETEEAFENFPRLLQALEKYTSNNILNAEDFNEIEYFHRVRNDLYHGATCLTIEKDKTEAYFAIAELLYNKLFHQGEVTKKILDQFKTNIGEFIIAWDEFEGLMLQIISNEAGVKTPNIMHINLLVEKNIFDKTFLEAFNALRQYRNKIVHSLIEINTKELDENINSLYDLLKKTQSYAERKYSIKLRNTLDRGDGPEKS